MKSRNKGLIDQKLFDLFHERIEEKYMIIIFKKVQKLISYKNFLIKSVSLNQKVRQNNRPL